MSKAVSTLLLESLQAIGVPSIVEDIHTMVARMPRGDGRVSFDRLPMMLPVLEQEIERDVVSIDHHVLMTW